jgi:hypothetical protein
MEKLARSVEAVTVVCCVGRKQLKRGKKEATQTRQDLTNGRLHRDNHASGWSNHQVVRHRTRCLGNVVKLQAAAGRYTVTLKYGPSSSHPAVQFAAEGAGGASRVT